MFEGGISYNSNSDKAIRYVAGLGTPIFVAYNLFVMWGFAPSNNYTNDLVTLFISALWIATGVYHFASPIRSRLDMLLRLIAYGLLSLATVVFITGFLQPFAACIALLFLASNIYFGRIALGISIAAVITTAVIDGAARYSIEPMMLWYNLIGVSAIIVLGVALVGIITAQETRRKALLHSQAQERLQYDRILTIINNLSDAAFSTDDKGNVIMYNAACLSLLDTNDSLKGKKISDLFNLKESTEDEAVNLYELMKDATKSTRRDDITHTYEDGESIRLEVTYAPIKANYSRHKKGASQGGFIVILRDITKQKSLEEERDEFISVVSHELRTPITIVEGTLSNLQVLANRPEGFDQKMTQTMVNTAHDQIMYLAKMVNDLSTLSRAERGAADATEDVDVTELLQHMYHQYTKEADKKGLHLNIDLGSKLGIVHVSRLYFEELLQNFITNAIKYTQEGTVTITAKRAKGVVTFTVKDSGIGISRGDQIKIFHKFYRSEDYRIRETGGTGLGLYVSAKLARKLGTKIELKSRLNHGSSFSFELPAKS